jgi:2'-5' RNA ligase
VLRAVHIFPEFTNQHLIDELRVRYDPLQGLIPPHITLVFPFAADVSSDELAHHLSETAARFAPFAIALQGVTGAEGWYLFLNVKVGNDSIIALHDALYTGPLQGFLDRAHTYIPHLTVGRCEDDASWQRALAETEAITERFETVVDELVLERIEADGRSVVEWRVSLGGACAD